MKKNKLTVDFTRRPTVEASPLDAVVSFSEFNSWIHNGQLLKHLFKHSETRLLAESIDRIPRAAFHAAALRMTTLGPCRITEPGGRSASVGPAFIASALLRFAKDSLKAPKLLARVRRDIAALASSNHPSGSRPRPPDFSFPPAYLRTDPSAGVFSGGSVGHIAGVLNSLDSFIARPLFISTDDVPTVRPEIEKLIVSPTPDFSDFHELPSMAACYHFFEQASQFLRDKNISFVYQRHSLHNFSGVMLSRRLGVPLILEYNSSAVWEGNNWGKGLKYPDLASEAEALNLNSADVIVVVSAPLRDELLERGIDQHKILVNPNGIDPDVYRPDIDGSRVRKMLGFGDRTVVGFIGTFGPWHGAEVLAEAYGALLERRPELRESTRLLLIGDGSKMPLVKASVKKYNMAAQCALPGLVPQAQGPEFLAACDILASPHVPNSDGSPFFGSPTKLFEYMAMGRGIVASDLEQIGETLEHGRTALLVKPGDAAALADGIAALLDDKALRDSFGAAAREVAAARHTWKIHTGRIIEKIVDICGSANAGSRGGG